MCTALAGWPEDCVGTAELLASELVTNAVRHALPPLALRVLLEPGTARLEVRDSSSDRPQVVNHGDDLTLSGRGMLLVDALADGWGVEAFDGDGKTVWCQIRS